MAVEEVDEVCAGNIHLLLRGHVLHFDLSIKRERESLCVCLCVCLCLCLCALLNGVCYRSVVQLLLANENEVWCTGCERLLQLQRLWGK